MEAMAGSNFETADGIESASIRQISVFMDNRVGQLLRLIHALKGSNVRILAMQVDPAADCAIVRMVLDDTDTGLGLIKASGFATHISELIVVEMSPGTLLLTVCSALLSAELNIDYVYPLLAQPTGHPALALHCDNQHLAIQLLRKRDFTLLTEDDLNPPR